MAKAATDTVVGSYTVLAAFQSPRDHGRARRLVYPAAIPGVTHFWRQVKADWREPAVYAGTAVASR